MAVLNYPDQSLLNEKAGVAMGNVTIEVLAWAGGPCGSTQSAPLDRPAPLH